MEKYKLRLIPLGGIRGVTKNMYVYEIYINKNQKSKIKNQKLDNNFNKNDYYLQDILIIDCGIGFPQAKELGVDFVIPDISYLKDKTDKIRAVILTHGHEDHISALPFYYQLLGRPPIFTGKLTKALIENKFKEFSEKGIINEVQTRKTYYFGGFALEFIRLTHSIPDTFHLLIKTPIGNLYHGTDFKLDLTPPYGLPPDFYAINKAGQEKILCLLSDCLGAEREGLTLSESVVGERFEEEMRRTQGKFIMTTFSSNISRIRQCVQAAIKFNRKICFLGRSMKENTTLASEIGYLGIPPQFLVKEDELKRLPPKKICLIVAGSQGQYDSALAKLSRDQNHYVKITAGDKIIFSSDPIPGNEEEVYGLIEELIEKGAEVFYPDIADQLHASGHANQEDLKFLIRFVNPEYFIPIGGTLRHQRQYQNLVVSLGYPKNKVFLLAEGETVWFLKDRVYQGEIIETKNIYVDAYGVGDVGNLVLRDRKTLSLEGIVMAVLVVDNQGRLMVAPKIISRGFVFEKEEKLLYYKAKNTIEKILKPKKEKIFNFERLKRELINNLEELFFEETGRKPLVLAEIIQV
ncbi:MAG: ribonuclease J [Patescibacteria group bacterium]|nr:ribonuclease J [Patescibacteria group bacterium]